ncbi:MAG: hypothetical protein VX796_00800 [Pseudomonadota bacterium]|jgi:hypothetical protein|nr:hypothetical protein [Pseudomonadota bacterium]
MSFKTWAVVLGATALSGCFGVNTSQAPIATTYPISEQQRMQAAHHWEVLAEHEARAILSDRRLRQKALYIAPEMPTTAFAEGFRALLTSELVSRGAIVKTRPEAAVEIDFDVQVIRHRDRTAIRKPQGALTALAAGIAVATLPYNHWTEPALGLIPAAAVADVFSGSWTSETNHEVIITVSADEYDTLLYSSSNLYYISGGDSGQYDRKQGRLAVSSDW